jgi:hypothetical protein
MKYTMSVGELGKLTLIKGAIDGAYTVRETAKGLKLSERAYKAAETAGQRGRRGSRDTW